MDVKKHELIAVEYGKDIYDVTDALLRQQRMIWRVCLNRKI